MYRYIDHGIGPGGLSTLTVLGPEGYSRSWCGVIPCLGTCPKFFILPRVVTAVGNSATTCCRDKTMRQFVIATAKRHEVLDDHLVAPAR